MKTEPTSIRISKMKNAELVVSVGNGDSKLTLWRDQNGWEAIETNGDSLFEGEEGFEEAREQIMAGN